MPANTGYRLALRTPGAARFFGAACPARLGIAMTGLGIVWLVHWRTNSYGSAGIVTGGFAVSEAVIGPQVARLIDRFGQTRVLPRCLLAHGVAVALLLTAVVNNRPLWLIVAAGILAGSSIPQIARCRRRAGRRCWTAVRRCRRRSPSSRWRTSWHFWSARSWSRRFACLSIRRPGVPWPRC